MKRPYRRPNWLPDSSYPIVDLRILFICQQVQLGHPPSKRNYKLQSNDTSRRPRFQLVFGNQIKLPIPVNEEKNGQKSCFVREISMAKCSTLSLGCVTGPDWNGGSRQKFLPKFILVIWRGRYPPIVTSHYTTL